MAKVDEYRAALARLGSVAAWRAYLLKHSGLPGPRGNLELLAAAFVEGDEPVFAACRNHPPATAPADSAEVFLVMVGVVGLAKAGPGGDAARLGALRAFASDPRWRVREAVAIGLQYIGDRDVAWLLGELAGWKTGSPLEQRAVVAALCEPRLLRAAEVAPQVLAILAEITNDLPQRRERKTEAFKALRQALGYGWSVAVVAAPGPGKAAFERLIVSPDADVRWIAKENLGKNRLIRMDAAWVEAMRGRLETEPGRPAGGTAAGEVWRRTRVARTPR